MLSREQRSTYEWQMWVPDFGEAGQEALSGASVLVSRVGGLGSVVALELAAAGVGRLVLAHAGDVRPSDLNRQVLMTHAALGTSRVECATGRLRELNPRLEIEPVPANIGPGNAAELVDQVDLVVDCAPLFEERLSMNDEAVRQGKPIVECAMYDLEGSVMTVNPGRSACLRCLVPQPPAAWKREFPVFGAVSGTIGCIGAMEAIKVIAGVGDPLYGRMLMMDLRSVRFRIVEIAADPNCMCRSRS